MIYNFEQTRDKMNRQMWTKVESQMCSQVDFQVWTKVEFQMCSQVDFQVWTKIRSPIRRQIRRQTLALTRNLLTFYISGDRISI